jgi:hypothetical protein
VEVKAEGCLTGTQQELGIWKVSRSLLQDTGSRENLTRDGRSQVLPDSYLLNPAVLQRKKYINIP